MIQNTPLLSAALSHAAKMLTGKYGTISNASKKVGIQPLTMGQLIHETNLRGFHDVTIERIRRALGAKGWAEFSDALARLENVVVSHHTLGEVKIGQLSWPSPARLNRRNGFNRIQGTRTRTETEPQTKAPTEPTPTDNPERYLAEASLGEDGVLDIRIKIPLNTETYVSL